MTKTFKTDLRQVALSVINKGKNPVHESIS